MFVIQQTHVVWEMYVHFLGECFWVWSTKVQLSCMRSDLICINNPFLWRRELLYLPFCLCFFWCFFTAVVKWFNMHALTEDTNNKHFTCMVLQCSVITFPWLLFCIQLLSGVNLISNAVHITVFGAHYDFRVHRHHFSVNSHTSTYTFCFVLLGTWSVW